MRVNDGLPSRLVLLPDLGGHTWMMSNLCTSRADQIWMMRRFEVQSVPIALTLAVSCEPSNPSG